MATHSNILAWKIPWTEKPGRLQSMGSQRVRHNWVTSLKLNIWERYNLVYVFMKGIFKYIYLSCLSSVQFIRSIMSDSATPWIAARQVSLSITNCRSPPKCPSSWWCHPAILSSVIPFSSCPQCLPASGSFLMSQLFAWGGQSTGVSVSASVLPMNTQDWYPSGWTGWISLQSKGLSRAFSNTTVESINYSALNFLHSPTLTSIHDY